MAETDVKQQGLNSKRYLNDKYKGYKRRFHPRDYWSCITHGIGIFFGIIATIYMAIEKSKSAEDAMFPYVAFGLSITALYGIGATRQRGRRQRLGAIETGAKKKGGSIGRNPFK